MRMRSVVMGAFVVAGVGLAAQATYAANVKITPLGSHDGEFCARDRALVFEDPDGTRILYDAGFTVRGGDDPRLGKIDVVLISHVHADHLGSAHSSEANNGTCEKPKFDVKDAPNSNTVKIAAAKKAKFVLGGEQRTYFPHMLEAAGGSKSQVAIARFGGEAKIGGVRFTTVTANHTNGLDADFLEGPLAEMMDKNGLTAYVGPPAGYVVQFTNGLVAYLSGDTGINSDQDTVVRRYYHANLAVMNIGGVFSTGPAEAAWVMNELVKPRSIIASHANEEATKGGKLLPGTKTAAFKKATKAPVYIPLSGKTMEFDGHGKCVSGC